MNQQQICGADQEGSRHLRTTWSVAICAFSACITVCATYAVGIPFIFRHVLSHAHRGLEMYCYTAYVFAGFLGSGLFILVYSGLRNGAVFILASSVTGHAAFAAACFVYSFTFQTERALNSLSYASLPGTLIPFGVIFPLISGSWITGAFAGWLVLILRNVLSKRQMADLRSIDG